MRGMPRMSQSRHHFCIHVHLQPPCAGARSRASSSVSGGRYQLQTMKCAVQKSIDGNILAMKEQDGHAFYFNGSAVAIPSWRSSWKPPGQKGRKEDCPPKRRSNACASTNGGDNVIKCTFRVPLIAYAEFGEQPLAC